MANSISELYQDYRKRLSEVDSIEQELLRTNDKQVWIDRLLKKSGTIREYYQITEKDLDTYITPILNGDEPLDDTKAQQLYEGAYEYFMNVLSDDVLESQMFVKLWEYFHQNGNEYKERTCKYAFSNNPFLNVEGNLQKMALEQAEWVSTYMDRIDYLRDFHKNDEDFVRDVKRVMGTIKHQYNMESCKFEPNVNQLIQCFNKLSKIRRFREYFSDEIWEELQTQFDETGTDVLFMAALNWNKVDEDKKKEIGPAFPIGFIEQSKLSMEERNMKIYVGYVVYAFYSKMLEPEHTFTLLRAYSRAVTKEYDFNSPDWYAQPDDSKFSMLCATTKPMLQMIREFSCDDATKERLTAELLYEVKTYIETIPRECACKEYLDQTLYHMLYDLIEFIDDEEQAIEFIDCMIISRQLSTLIHTVMTAELTKILTEHLIEKRPELFFTLLGVDTKEEVFEKKAYVIHLAYNAARVHDIGKILIANIVNTQIRRLSDMEYSYIKFHPKWSYEILIRNPHLANYAEIALGHHKSYDGKSGYPAYFDNTHSRYRILIDILTVCDCLDAATDMLGRNYVTGKGYYDVLQEFILERGHLYSPDVVDLLTENKELSEMLATKTSIENRIDTYYKIYRQYK